jgi:hypothetical protein
MRRGGYLLPSLTICSRDDAGEPDEFFRVLRLVFDANLVMHLRTGTAAGAPEKADLVVLGDPLADRHSETVEMRVQRGDAIKKSITQKGRPT